MSDGRIGFLDEASQDPITFLSIDEIQTLPYAYENDDTVRPNFEVSFLMGDNKSLYVREAYTVLSLLGDFGGFTDALTLIAGIFTSVYSSRMF